MCSWHVVQEVIVKSKNEIVHVEDEIVTLVFSRVDSDGCPAGDQRLWESVKTLVPCMMW